MDRRIEYPDKCVPLLTWWDGIYDSVFIALHPFFRIRRRDAAPDDRSLSAFEDTRAYYSREYDGWGTVNQRAEPVPWHEVHMAVSPDTSRADFYYSVWYMSSGLGIEAGNPGRCLREKIRAYCRREKLILPEEDVIGDVMHEPIARFLQHAGAASVDAWDEFRDNSITMPVSAFGKDTPAVRLPEAVTTHCPYAVHSDECGILITAGYDSSYSFVAMTDVALRRARPEHFFEGEYATAETLRDFLNDARRAS